MSLRAAILGFLELEPTSGYTLKQRFDGSVGSFWTATQSQIYRELHALADQGLVKVHREAGGDKPDRKVYALTPAGHAALRRWLQEPLDPLQLRHPLLLKFVFAADMEPAALDALLQHYATRLTALEGDYRARLAMTEIFSLARSPREAEVWRLAIEHGLAWCAAERHWIELARQRLGKTP